MHASYYLTYILLLAAVAHGAPAKPIALIHVGPPKTATTHFQSVLVKFRQDYLNSRDYDIWPDLMIDQKNCELTPYHREKQMANFARVLRNTVHCPQVENTMKSFLKSSLAKKRSIILSSEIFWTVLLSNPAALFDYLDGFHIHIVLTYRLHSNILISTFDELIKDGNYDGHFPALFYGP